MFLHQVSFWEVYNFQASELFLFGACKGKGRTFAQVKVVNLKPLPIRTIDFTDPNRAIPHRPDSLFG